MYMVLMQHSQNYMYLPLVDDGVDVVVGGSSLDSAGPAGTVLAQPGQVPFTKHSLCTCRHTGREGSSRFLV